MLTVASLTHRFMSFVVFRCLLLSLVVVDVVVDVDSA